MEGLEKRKRIAELLGFGCGFTVAAGTHVAVEVTEGGYARVRPVEGSTKKAGWVPTSWVGPAKP